MLALLALPSPLHPAAVHFPIVLLLLGTVVAITAAFTRRWQLPLVAAVLLGLGAIGTVVAVQTGESQGEVVGETPAIEAVLDQHEAWAERTQVAAIVVALLAAAALATTRWPVAARGLGLATGAGALLVAWCVIQTGHYGGQLVYRHGAGVNLMAADGTAPAPAGQTGKKSRHGERDDD
ncbi:MAG: DUF2231 domain-containing protein [Opitutae bacterium]